MHKDICPIQSFDRVRPEFCDPACSMLFPEPDEVYANRCECALERGDMPPTRDTFCALAVMAEMVRKQSPGVAVQVKAMLASREQSREVRSCSA